MLNSYSHTANTTRQFTVTSAYPYGTYTIKAVAGETVVSTWLSVVDVTGWQQTGFPYERSHNGLDYTFFANGTIKAENQQDIMLIDLSTLRTLVNLYDLDVTATYNSMNFRVNFQKAGILNVNFVFSFIHTGCKFVVEGELDQARDFSFNIQNPSRLKKLVDSVKQGNLIFDYSDLRKAAHVFSYSNGILTLSLPQQFSFDPVIFSDGFEGNPFNEWSSTSGTPTVVTSPVHHGVNATEFDSKLNEFLVYSFASEENPFSRCYINFTSLHDSGQSTEFILAYRDVTTGYYLARLGVKNDGGVHKWQLIYRDNGGYTTALSTQQTPTTGEWYSIELEALCSTADGNLDGEYRVYVDGNNLTDIAQSGIDTDVTNAEEFRCGQVGTRDITYVIDCVVLSDEYIGVEGEEGQNVVETLEESASISSSLVDGKELLISSGESASGSSSVGYLKELLIYSGETTTLITEIETQTELGVLLVEEIVSETIEATATLYIGYEIAVTMAETLGITSIIYTSMELGVTLVEIFETASISATLHILTEILSLEELDAAQVALAIALIASCVASLAFALYVSDRKEG